MCIFGIDCKNNDRKNKIKIENEILIFLLGDSVKRSKKKVLKLEDTLR